MVEHEILSLERGAMERWRQGDPLGWAEISAPDVTYLDPGMVKPITGLGEYERFLESLVGKIHYQGSEFIEPRVVELGDMALLTYNYRSTQIPADGGQQRQTLWNTTEVYCRQAGQWRIAHTHWSYVRHRLPARVEVPVPVEQAAQPLGGALGEVMALESAAMERWRKGDPWGFIEISAPDVTYFDSGTPLRLNGREALRSEYAQREGKIFYDVMEFIDPSLQAWGDAGVLFYRFFSTRLNPDGSVAGRTPWNCSEVYARGAEGWRIIHTHWSLIGGEQEAQ